MKGEEIQLLANCVDTFQVDLTNLSEGSVDIQINYSLEKKEYQETFTVALRNEPKKAENIKIQ